MHRPGGQEARRPTERDLIPRAGALLALLVFTAPCGLRAQEHHAPMLRTGLAVEGSYRLSGLRGRTTRMLGGAVLFTIDGRLGFGLAGWTLFSPMALARPGGTLDFGFAYGGAVGEVRVARSGRTAVSARLLVGAGNAKLTVPAVDTEIEADNFGILEPEVSGVLRVGGPVDVAAALGYRLAFGVQDLPGILQRDLGGWTTRVSLILHTF